jgi:RHS repeat-associated protein
MEQTKGVQGNGQGNFYDYKNRDYDAWKIRFNRTDALESKYPFYSPYQFAGNKPIKFIDIDGLEPGVLNLSTKAAIGMMNHLEAVEYEVNTLKLFYPDWSSARLYATAEWNIWSQYTDIDDITVLTTAVTRNGNAVHTNGDPASKADIKLAAGGILIPLVLHQPSRNY